MQEHRHRIGIGLVLAAAAATASCASSHGSRSWRMSDPPIHEEEDLFEHPDDCDLGSLLLIGGAYVGASVYADVTGRGGCR
jgi:hypothetical protein